MSDASVDNRAPLSGAGWRAADLDERTSGHAFRPRASEEGSGSQAPASASEASNAQSWRAADLDERASRHVLSSASERGKRWLQERDPREQSEPSDTARASGTGSLGVQWTRRTTCRILPTRLQSASPVASVALRLTDFTQLPQLATFVRQPRCRGPVEGETGCRCICAHSVDICVEREVAVPHVPARQGKGTDNSRSLLRVSASRSDARRLPRRLRSHQ
jgi:hypothetical protein